MIEVNIDGKNLFYPIIFDRNDLSELKKLILEKVCDEKFVIIISKKVYSLYKKILSFDKKDLFVINDGEKEKNFKNYHKILNFCSKKELTRDSYIVAIGGGVVGDIAGFVAATYMRGINLIHIPTTLLACVDSSVGGKTAINTCFGKNIVGSFYQPSCVIINPNFLKTLDLKNIKCGLGEIVKYGLIEKSCLLNEELNIINLLGENYKQIFNYDLKILTRLIEYCIKLKVSVVQKDEKECNLRRILNFGHTFGHAVEIVTKFRKYSHGECVVEGIRFAFDLAKKNNLIEDNYYFVVLDLLEKFDFVKIPQFDIKKLIPIMKTDKKATSDFIRFILPTKYATVQEFKVTELLTIS